jgi:hypothetical protein
MYCDSVPVAKAVRIAWLCGLFLGNILQISSTCDLVHVLQAQSLYILETLLYKLSSGLLIRQCL